jgi:hypothetical protein
MSHPLPQFSIFSLLEGLMPIAVIKGSSRRAAEGIRSEVRKLPRGHSREYVGFENLKHGARHFTIDTYKPFGM